MMYREFSAVKPFRLALCLAAMSAAAPAFAQQYDADAAERAKTQNTGDYAAVGVAAVTIPDYEGSNDNYWTVAPGAIGRLGGVNFTLIGNRFSADLISDHNSSGIDFQAGPIAVVDFNRTSTKSIDDPRVKALGKLDTAIELGGYVGIGKIGVITSPFDRLSVSVSYRHDVSGVHDSGIWQPTVNYMTPLSRKALVALFVSAEHAERGYADAYYTITPAQSAASGLPVYYAHGGWKNWAAGGVASMSLTGDLTHGLQLVGGGVYRGLMNDFADSPITSVAGSKDQWTGFVGLAYSF